MLTALSQHLPALIVFIPLILAPIACLMPRPALAWLVALIASWASFACTVGVTIQLWSMDANIQGITYHMGGWIPPIGIEYRIDPLSSFVLLVITGIAAVMAPFARHSVAERIAADKQSGFYSLYLLCLMGMLGIIATHDAFNFYVFLEISSLATYALIAMGRDRRALSASYQYLIIGTIGATFILIGIGFLYIMTGTLNMSDLAARIAVLEDTRPVLAAFAFITVGVSMKIALFPLHMWLPNAYTFAPNFVSAFMAATATKVGIYALLRFIFTVFGASFAFDKMPVGEVLVLLSIPAILVGSLVAVFQPALKRMLAYSSIAQIGYIALGIGLGSITGLTAAIVHIANHAMAKGALFMAIACIAYGLSRAGTDRIKLHTVTGLARQMPWSCMAFTLAGLALIGVPLSAGFVSKWYLITAAMNAGQFSFILVSVVIAGSLLAILYIWRTVDTLYFAENTHANAKQVKEAPLAMLIPTWVLVLLCYYTGMDTRWTLELAAEAAAFLLDQGGTQIALQSIALEAF